MTPNTVTIHYDGYVVGLPGAKPESISRELALYVLRLPHAKRTGRACGVRFFTVGAYCLRVMAVSK